MEIIYLVLGAALAVAAGCLYSAHMKKKNIHAMLKKQFGKKPEYKDYDFDRIKIFWKETARENEEGCIDDITWNDLDMDQVFERINMCCSSVGEQYLYKKLRSHSFDGRKLDSFEKKVMFALEHEDDRIEIQKKLLRIGKRENHYYVSLFLNDPDHYKLDRIWVYYVLQIFLFVAAILSVLLRDGYAYAFLGIMFLTNMNVYALMKSKYETNIDLIAAVQSILQTSKELAKNKNSIVSEAFAEGVKKAGRITGIMSFVSGRRQRQYTADFMEMCGTYITGAFLFDFVLYNRILEKLKTNRTEISGLFEQLGEWDMAVSTASFRKSVPLYCVPCLGGEHNICYEDVYNPLLDEPVCNDFCLDAHCIVTGSNASGKSTFIKAIAINEILAMSIHTCTARTAAIREAEVYTSMAIRDDLLAGESYFVREIKSLKRILDVIGQGRFVITVIDEILRGTNTKERIAASAAILNYLEDKNCALIVASHDIELVHLMEGGKYSNYCFCEKAEEREVVFDYKIHKGVCEQRNAIRLLEFLGFPEEVVRNANKSLQRKI